MKVKIINRSINPLPSYETIGSAGMDLRANIDAAVELKPLERNLIPTGLFIELPNGYEAQIRPRSGLAVKKGLTLLNTPGTIDSDYRGEICVALLNTGDDSFELPQGSRLCQLIIEQIITPTPAWSDELEDTTRGTGGFGSTGHS